MSRLATRSMVGARGVLLSMLAALLMALPFTVADPPGGWGELSEESCDCCPDKTPGDGEDCCDTDGGFCCTGTSVALSLTTQSNQAPLPMRDGRALMPASLFLPRANAPPPTPPPIG